MSALNITIERMTRQRSLSSVVLAYGYAALLVAGPWIFTILGIAGLSATRCDNACDQLAVFRSVVIHNALFALVVTSPLAFFFGRYVADRVDRGEPDRLLFAFMLSVSLFALIVAATVVPFYLLVVSLPGPARLAAIQSAFLVGTSWLLILILAAAGPHRPVMLAFGFNAGATLLKQLHNFCRHPLYIFPHWPPPHMFL